MHELRNRKKMTVMHTVTFCKLELDSLTQAKAS